MRHGRASGIVVVLIAAIAAACGHGDGRPPDATAVAGDAQTAGDGSGHAPAPVPPAASDPTVAGARVLAALKGYVAREWALRATGTPPGWLLLYPDGVPEPASSGVFYAWSQALVGDRATVSSVYTYANERPTMSVEFLVAHGAPGYVADLTLRIGSDMVVFDEVALIAAEDWIALDVPVFTWQVDTAGGRSTVALLPRSVAREPSAFELCWQVRYRGLDRLSCSVHGAGHAATVEDASGGTVRRIRTPDGTVPWNPEPPAGTPAPPPTPGPMRYVLGSEMVQRLLAPTGGTGDRSIALSATDGSGSVARLDFTSPQVGWSFPAPIRSTVASEIDGAGPVAISYTAPSAYRYPVTGRIEDLSLRTAEGTRALPGSFTVDPAAIYPLDATLLETSDGVATVRALLRSIDGARTGYRFCWSATIDGFERLACGVEDTPGSTGWIEDTRQGTTRVYR